MTSSLVKRGKVWYLRVDLGKDPISGKRDQRMISTKCERKPDAQKVATKILNDMEQGTYADAGDVTFVEFMGNWLNNQVKRSVQETTFQGYRILFDFYIKPHFDKIKLKDLRPMHLQKYYDYLSTDGRRTNRKTEGCGLSASSIRRHHAIIRKCLDFALKMQLIAVNPALAVELPKVQKFHGKAYTVEQVQQLIDVAKAEPVHIAIILAAGLGLRRGEVCGLKWSHIDFDKDMVKIDTTRTGITEIIEKGTKNESSNRVLPLPANIKAFLKKVRKKQMEQQLLCGNGYVKSDYVATMLDGQPIKPGYISQAMARIIKQNGLEPIRFHDLRHTNATLLLQKNVNIKWISEWLGHSNISTTMDIYSHVTQKMKKEVAKEIDNIFSIC